MALVNHAKREINAKIVYYGPAGCGKQSTLQYIYNRIKPSLRGELKIVPTGGDNLCCFDFSPLATPLLDGYRIRFHLYTFSGYVHNPAAWKMTLKGADGIIICCGHDHEQFIQASNSIAALRDYIGVYGVGLHDIPWVVQLTNANSRNTTFDFDRIADLLNLSDAEIFQSNAGTGEGALEALNSLSRKIFEKIGERERCVAKCDKGGLEHGPDPGERPNTLADLESIALLTQHEVSGQENINPIFRVRGEHSLEPGGANVVRIPLELDVAGVIKRVVLNLSVDLLE